MRQAGSPSEPRRESWSPPRIRFGSGLCGYCSCRSFAMRFLLLSLLVAGSGALAADYRVDPGASVHAGTLKVEPTVQGPAGAALRYEIRTTREGAGGRSNSSQSGNVRLGEDGSAKLATT